jgi:hypothetical protein
MVRADKSGCDRQSGFSALTGFSEWGYIASLDEVFASKMPEN